MYKQETYYIQITNSDKLLTEKKMRCLTRSEVESTNIYLQ